MELDDLDELAGRAVGFFGPRNQTMKVMEELGELTAEIARFHTRPTALTPYAPEQAHAALLSEAADVFIMIRQMRHMLGPDKFDQAVALKALRLKARIEGLQVVK